MKRFATVALVPCFAGFLWAQAGQQADAAAPPQEQSQTRTTTTTTWNGTLVDASCHSTHTEHRSTETTNPTEGTTKTTTTKTNTETTECPATMTTTTFGLMTPEGKYVRFDDPGNTRIVEVVKSKKWDKELESKKPVRVQVIGTANGDILVVKSIK